MDAEAADQGDDDLDNGVLAIEGEEERKSRSASMLRSKPRGTSKAPNATSAARTATMRRRPPRSDSNASGSSTFHCLNSWTSQIALKTVSGSPIQNAVNPGPGPY
jgi:hypothetical protein